MPVYDYRCADCGPFTLLSPMAEASAAQSCPACGAQAPRAILTAPRLATMPGATRRAHETNEKSRHAPGFTSTKGHVHGPGCGCGGPGKPAAANGAPPPAKGFPSKRPWMISH
ncbi:FmdB family zinc ribbon protein [Acidimangrovimonas sediminis]|uniref:FmdB family zinc ribbon protein n=1 Tax=Acidimangrovimonas sediminis TaxID=2056283 RepID=UPI000C80B00A|nr:zinc ribbon domain-containing protein [Acidimangrovimonas sediminis]